MLIRNKISDRIYKNGIAKTICTKYLLYVRVHFKIKITTMQRHLHFVCDKGLYCYQNVI